MLRTASPLNPESLASFDQRLISNRSNPYFKPLGYNQLATGLESFANTPCAAGIDGHACRPGPGGQRRELQRPRRRRRRRQASQLYDLVRSCVHHASTSTASVPAPPCSLQGPFRSIGRSPEQSDYLHVRRQP